MDEKLTLNEMKVLSVLTLGEQYGLEIIKSVQTGEGTTIQLGSLYNLLFNLKKKGYVEGEWGETPPMLRPPSWSLARHLASTPASACWRAGAEAAAYADAGSPPRIASAPPGATHHARNVAPIIAEIRRAKLGISARGVARELELRSVPTARGGAWGPGSVLNVERRVRRLRGR